jgi:predicted nucleic acid-binding protein
VTSIVADASVVVKWLVPERGGETDVEQALWLLDRFSSGQVRLVQPPHWLAEAAAVVTRLSPATAERKIAALYEMDCGVLASESIYLAACSLAIELNHHLFDTLYHAVALQLPDAFLVTADEKYYRKAHDRGRIVRLADFSS